MSKRWTPANYDDWLTTDPDAEADKRDDADGDDNADDWQEPDDTPDLEPQYIGWL